MFREIIKRYTQITNEDFFDKGFIHNFCKKYMLTVFGSTALDTIRTPKKTLKNVLGGAATFAAISASFSQNQD